MTNNLQKILLGVAIGDALGVPVEFKPRFYFQENPIIDMQEFGVHDQLKGTWSDDTSLTLCLAESIKEGLNLDKLAQKFIAWKNDNYWTARGWVFDIGIGTRMAIERLQEGIAPELAGGTNETENGNGSLMRILPLIIFSKDLEIDERFEWTRKVSSLTHGHIRSIMACFYYLEFAKKIMEGIEKFKAYKELQTEVLDYFESRNIDVQEIDQFKRLLHEDISLIDEVDIKSSGYVMHTLEASIWCLLTSSNYSEAVLKAVNLGSDTDTTAAVTGGLAVLVYGTNDIPKEWIEVLARREELINF